MTIISVVSIIFAALEGVLVIDNLLIAEEKFKNIWIFKISFTFILRFWTTLTTLVFWQTWSQDDRTHTRIWFSAFQLIFIEDQWDFAGHPFLIGCEREHPNQWGNVPSAPLSAISILSSKHSLATQPVIKKMSWILHVLKY